MKNKYFKRMLALALVAAMSLTACGQKEVSNSESQGSDSTVETEIASETETTVDKGSLPTITLYPQSANLFSGLVTGHRGDYFAENGFQLEVWAYSDEKTTAMLTSGDLPDMMYIGNGGVELLETLIDTGKIINYEDYKEYLPNYFENPYSEYVDDNYDVIRKTWSSGTDGLYVLPWGLGSNNGIYSQVGAFDRNVVKLKWDVYEAIGAPEITDMWQLLDVVEEMLAYQPETEDGNKMYGTFLDNGMDTDRFGGMFLWYRWHGYSDWIHAYLVEQDNVNGTLKSIFDDDSLYKEGVRWYHEMYERDLMDPDSISTSRTDQAPKLDNGLAMLPSGTLPGWATKYYEVFVPGTTVHCGFTAKEMGGIGSCVVVNAEAENLEECLAFVNMLADPYAALRIQYGPEGDIWKSDGNVLSITDEFAAWLETNGSINFFPMSDGTEWSTWNTPFAVSSGEPIDGYVDINGEDLCYIPTSWPDAQNITNANENWKAWQETMDADGLWDYCEKNNITAYQESKFDGVPFPTLDDNLTLIKSTVKDVVVPATWNMIYADSDEELEEIWDQMVEDAMALGAQDVIDFMIENYVPKN